MTDTTHLNHSNLIGHKTVLDNEIALGYVQTFFRDRGGDQQVDFTVSEFVQHVLLLSLVNTNVYGEGEEESTAAGVCSEWCMKLKIQFTHVRIYVQWLQTRERRVVMGCELTDVIGLTTL